jgi:hypothetical protein
MKMNLLLLSATALYLTSNLALAECTYPKAPDAPPDAKAATQPEMIAAMSAFKQYNADVDAYVVCLDEETAAKVKEAGGTGAIMQIKAMQSKKKNSALDERAAKIDVFNKAVRDFKSRG